MDPQYTQQQDGGAAHHPYLHEPLLYISNLPAYVTDENLAQAFVTCGPFRPKIVRDSGASVLAGTIEFKFLDKGARDFLPRNAQKDAHIVLIQPRKPSPPSNHVQSPVCRLQYPLPFPRTRPPPISRLLCPRRRHCRA